MKRHSFEYALLIFVSLFLVSFLLAPVAYILSRAFLTAEGLSAASLYLMFSSPYYGELVLNSLNVAIGATVLTTIIALPLSLIQARYLYRGKSMVSFLLLLPLFLPAFSGSIGFRQIVARFGTINILLLKAGIISMPIDFLGEGRLFGVVLLQSLHLFPVLYLILYASLASLDVSLEEAAMTAGATRGAILRRIVLPLLVPAYVAGASIVFVSSFTDLGTPLLFEYRDVLPVHIFNLLSDPRDNPVVYSLILIVALCSVLLFLLPRFFIRDKIYETPSKGKTFRKEEKLNGLLGFAAYGGLLVLIALSLLPHTGVVLVSVSERWFMSPLPQSYTFEHFHEVFTHPLSLVSLRNSFLLSIASTLLDIVLALSIAYLLVRSKIRGIGILDSLSTLPLSIPGIVIAFGYIRAFSGTFLDNRVNPFPLLIVAYAIRKLPLMVKNVSAGFMQVPRSFEEAAAIAGAGKFTIMRRITAPLLMPAIISGSVLCFSASMLEVSDSLILAMEDKFSPVSRALYTLSGRPDGIPIACALSVVVVLFLWVLMAGAARMSGRTFRDLFRMST